MQNFKRSLLTSLLFLLTAVLLQGCVLSSTHEALQKQFDQSQSTLTEREGTIVDLQQRISELEEFSKKLGEEKNRIQDKLTAVVKDKSQLEGSVAEMQEALKELERRKAEADARISEYKNFVAKFQKLIDEGKLKIKIREGRMVVELATDVLFGSGKAKLSEDGEVAIMEVAALLATIPEKKFQVEGHTDNIPMKKKYPSNWELASARAIAVVKVMIEGGMPANRISGATYGDSLPTVSNDTPEGRSTNRRIEIVVVPDVSNLPGIEALQKL